MKLPLSGALRTRRVTSIPARGADEAVLGVVSLVRDVTEQAEADRALASLTVRAWILRPAYPGWASGTAICRSPNCSGTTGSRSTFSSSRRLGSRLRTSRGDPRKTGAATREGH